MYHALMWEANGILITSVHFRVTQRSVLNPGSSTHSLSSSESYLTLGFLFANCKMEIIITPTSTGLLMGIKKEIRHCGPLSA